MNEQATNKRVVAMARALGSMRRCIAAGNTEWQEKHATALAEMCEDLPSGSGFDSGSEIDMERSTPNRLVFTTAFHHMDENGMYDGWTEHDVVVTPDFETGFDLRVTGRDRRGIKEYIGEMFSYALSEEIPQWYGYPAKIDKGEAVTA